MKKTLKKLLCAVLVAVMLFSMAPAASALETVDGSFDYLVDYIRMNGTKDSDGNFQIGEYFKETGTENYIALLKIWYDKKDKNISFALVDDYSYTSGALMKIENDNTVYLTVYGEGDDSIEESLYTEINPSKYNGGALTYSFHNLADKSAAHKKQLCENADAYIANLLKLCDVYLYEEVGFGLGNFGFTKISSPAPVPELSFFDRIGVFFRIMFNAIKALFTIVS